MNIWDSDSGHFLGIGGARDRIDLVYGKYRSLAAGPDSSNPKIYSKTVRDYLSQWSSMVSPPFGLRPSNLGQGEGEGAKKFRYTSI